MDELERQFDELDPSDLRAVIGNAVSIVKAGRWNPDVADMFAKMVVINHGSDGLERFNQRIGEARKNAKPV